jgi:hypothetical protein
MMFGGSVPAAESTGVERPQSAASQPHWAFEPVRKPAVPAVDDPWIRSPIDAFVLAKLREAGFEPSPRADERTLLRRASFGLTGLPPTMADLKAFQNDAAPDAFERVVEKLLASPAYGQHWARHWLDVARYADTKGYVFTANPYYPYAYTYRDYVIDAFNDDVPYDTFIIEQIAADLVPEPRNERTLAALGFLTVGRRFSNNKHDILDDRIDVITRGFLGLTVACARCHDHKYDPIPTADYYSLYGVLASCEEPDELPYVGDPTQHPGYERFMAELTRKRERAEDYLSRQHMLLAAELRSRVGDYLRIVAEQEAGAKGEKMPRGIKPRVVERWQEFLARPLRAKDAAFSAWAALAKIPAERFAAEAPGTLEALVARGVAGDHEVNLLAACALLCDEPQSLAEAAESLARLFRAADSLWVEMEHPFLAACQVSPSAVRQVEKALAAGKSNAEGSRPDVLARVTADLRTLQAFLYATDSPIALTSRETRESLEVRESETLRRLEREADEFEAKSPDAPPRAMVVVDRERPVEPRIFERGDPRREGQSVPRQFLAALTRGPRQQFEEGSGRLELAREIASAANPLTARVIVNRVWQHHFGEGLVRSASNFGVIGEPPSHPELLDWLAAEFVEHDWSIKWLQREIMRSATYQQRSSNAEFGMRNAELKNTAAHKALDNPHSALRIPNSEDPQNRLLWRQNRRRLDFEPLRDSLLAWAGRLDTAHGGQPFRLGETPSVPRRTIYGLIDRQFLYEPLRYFDVASPDASAADRPRTIVPQQSLFLLNSPFVAEQARGLAKRVDSESTADHASQVVALYETVLLREPLPDELAAAVEFLSAGRAAEDSQDREGHLTRLEQLAQTLMVCNEAVFVN